MDATVPPRVSPAMHASMAVGVVRTYGRSEGGVRFAGGRPDT
jgi:hypothetical protein